MAVNEKKADILSWVLFIFALGILAYRVKDCREKEQAAEQRVVIQKKEEEQKVQAKIDKCLSKVSDAERSDCAKCLCSQCGDERIECLEDPGCRTLKFGDDDTPDAQTVPEIRLQKQVDCMTQKCSRECLTKK